jgi:hypothetical protein
MLANDHSDQLILRPCEIAHGLEKGIAFGGIVNRMDKPHGFVQAAVQSPDLFNDFHGEITFHCSPAPTAAEHFGEQAAKRDHADGDQFPGFCQERGDQGERPEFLGGGPGDQRR